MPGGEPWKEILRHRADQVHLSVHGKGPNILDINWLFVAPNLKQMKCSFWKSILGSWLNIKVGLTKSKPASHTEVFRQPIFSNPLILNTTGHPLGMCGCSEGHAVANFCRNPNLGLANKARCGKVAGQEGDPGVTSHPPGSATSVRE